MTRDFLAELKERLKLAGHGKDILISSGQEIPAEQKVKRYNVHKRSLPVGLDAVVLFSVTKTEGEWWVDHKLKSKVYQNEPEDTKTVIYYDLVPIGATPQEKSVFFNKKPTVLEDGDFKEPYRIN